MSQAPPSPSASLGAQIDALAQTIASREGANPARSYTAKLLSQGPAQCAKKLGEEAVEAALAAVSGDPDALASEAADLVFHLLVTLRACGVGPEVVAAALAAREGVSGLAEKAARADQD